MVASILFGVFLVLGITALFRFALRELWVSRASEYNVCREAEIDLAWLFKLRLNYTETEMRQMLEEIRLSGYKKSFYARKNGSTIIYRVSPVKDGYRLVPILRNHQARLVSNKTFEEEFEFLTKWD